VRVTDRKELGWVVCGVAEGEFQHGVFAAAVGECHD